MDELIEHPPTHYTSSLFVGAPPPFPCTSICHNILKNAVSCVNGHSMCLSCADTWKCRSKECPVCKVKLSTLVPQRNVDEAIGDAKVVCFTRLDSDGNLTHGDTAAGSDKEEGKTTKVDACDWVGPLKHAEMHFNVCLYAGVRCPYKGCGLLVARRDLPDHQRTCEHGKRVCKWAGCGVKFSLEALPAHESTCAKRHVSCPHQGCNESCIVLDELAEHVLRCMYRPQPCKWAGCGDKFALGALAAHEGTCTKRQVSCPHRGCNATDIVFDTLDAHMITCQFRELPCKWAGCGTSLAIAALAAHEGTCLKREVGCPNNGCNATRIKFDTLTAHRRTCHFETVACPYAAVGCTAYVPRKDVDAHKRDAMGTHNELLLARVCGMQQEASVSKEEALAMKQEAAKDVLGMKKEASTLKEESAKEMSAVQWEMHSLKKEVSASKEKVGMLEREAAKEVLVFKEEASTLREEMTTLKAEAGASKKEASALREEVTALKKEVSTLKKKVGTLNEAGKEVFEIKVKHAALTGAKPFVPWYPNFPTRIYSEERVVDGHTFSVHVDINDDRAPDQYGVYLDLSGGPLPCKVKYTFELVHHDGQAASAQTRSGEYTYKSNKEGWGYKDFMPKARLADAVANPYVDNGYVTFKCTFKVWE